MITYHENFVKELTFRIHDEYGNDLPVKQMLIRLYASVYDEKIYPQISNAPIDTDNQTYRLKKAEETETFLRYEVEKRDNLAKQFKRRATASTISDTSVKTAITALEIASVVALTTGVGLPIIIVLASTGLLLGLGSGVIHKTQEIFDYKAKKHDKINRR